MVAVHIERGGRGLIALLTRAVALDAQAAARVQEVGEGQLDVFVTTPFDAIASRRTFGTSGSRKICATFFSGASRTKLPVSVAVQV